VSGATCAPPAPQRQHHLHTTWHYTIYISSSFTISLRFYQQ